jgi:HK97 family phage prohead protease
MPLKRCETDDKPGWKWGDEGKCYPYTAGNEESEKAARKKALAQAAAMGEFEGTGENRSREPVEHRAAVVTNVDFAERIIDMIVVPYDQEAVVEYPPGSGRMVVESVAPGAFDGIETRGEHVTANRDHDYTRTVGKVLSYRSGNPTGLNAQVYVSETTLGDETLRLAADGVLKASAGMLIRRTDQVIKNGTRRVKRAFLDHVALVPNPAYKGAGVLAVRQERGSEAADEGPPPTPNLDRILRLLGMQD